MTTRLKIKKMSNRRVLKDEVVTRSDCEKKQGEFCYLHPEKKPPKTKNKTIPTKKEATPPSNESIIKDERSWLKQAHLSELQSELKTIDALSRGIALDLIDELKEENVFDEMLENRHFIRTFFQEVKDRVEDELG